MSDKVGALARVAWLLVPALGSPLSHAWAGDHHVAMVIDRSCSMDNNDPGWNAVLAPAMLGDILGERDRLEIFPQAQSCSSNGGEFLTGAAAVERDPRKVSAFKESLLSLPDQSSWQPAMDAAVGSLERYQSMFERRTFIIVYDGGRDICDQTGFRSNLETLAKIGAQSFVLGMGASARGKQLTGAFGADHTYPVNDTGEVLLAYANVFRKAFGAHKLPQGVGNPDFTVSVDPGATEAWVVAAADGEVRSVRAEKSNPGARRVTENVNGGWNIDSPDGRRGYQVAHLEVPNPGRWSFNVEASVGAVNWLLLQRFDVSLDVTLSTIPVAGMPVEVVVRPKGASAGSDLVVTASVRGQVVPCARQADASYRCGVTFDSAGTEVLSVTAVSDTVEANATQLVTIEKTENGFDCSSLRDQTVGMGDQITVTSVYRNNGAAVAPEAAWVEAWGTRYALRDDGAAPDTAPGDGVYSTQFVASQLGPVEIPFVASIAGKQYACRGSLVVQGWVHLAVATPPSVDVGPCNAESESLAGPAPEGCRNCGNCTGALVELNLEGSESSSAYVLQFGLDRDLPTGLSLYVVSEGDRSRVRPGEPVDIRIDSVRGGVVPMFVCTNRCPAGGDYTPAAILQLRVDGGPKFGPQSIDVPIVLTVQPSSFWTCWGRVVLTAIAGVVGAVIVVGFVRPCRFPRPGGVSRWRFPSRAAVIPVADLERLHNEYKPLQRFTAWTTWYRDEKLYIDAGRLISREARGALMEIHLHRRDGLPVAWLRPLGTSMWRVPLTPGMAQLPSNDGETYTPVPAEGEPLRLDCLYLDDEARFVVHFY